MASCAAGVGHQRRSRASAGGCHAILPVCEQILDGLAAAGAKWVQIDGPVLVKDLTARQHGALATAYERPKPWRHRPCCRGSARRSQSDARPRYPFQQWQEAWRGSRTLVQGRPTHTRWPPTRR
ncbi:hypothetical protein [Rhodovulum sulfidophilum]|uniref:hypothetical protein n=1 Tax=Rhodovulum sulfidophilum TaxID=35806 RepID=UPI003B972FDA